ncbi:hypothetical protein MHK_004699 [Candidatus Magnetomorum sp. HK-1]|nr:hypothetical protein MHK_004699 [Candidatus Magnetomorum sp. HK-1]
MKVFYDEDVNALYFQLSNEKPDFVSELTDNVNLDLTKDNKIIGIEILNASKTIDMQSLLSYSLELDTQKVFKVAA